MDDHPLAQTLARARALSAYLRPELGPPSGEGWAAADDLAPGSPRLEELIAGAQARLRTTAAAVVASAVLQGYQWPLLSAAAACYLLDRRVPDLSPATVRVRYAAGPAADALALLSPRFHALPCDPAASHPDSAVAAGLPELQAALRAEVEGHVGTVIGQICARLGCGPRGLWLAAADSLAGALAWVAQERRPALPPDQIESEVAAAVRAPASPLASRRTGLIHLRHEGRGHAFLERATCCHWHRAEGAEYCSTCPHRTPEDRRGRLLEYLASTEAQA